MAFGGQMGPPSGPQVPGQQGGIDPRVMALVQAAIQRQQGVPPEQQGVQWPNNPADLLRSHDEILGGGPDGIRQPPQFLGPPVHTSPHPTELDPGHGGYFGGFQPPGATPGGGAGGGPPQGDYGGPGFLGPPIHPPGFDGDAAGRHRQREANRQQMHPQRALAIQEMGKYMQAYGKLHQQRLSLKEALNNQQRN